MFGLRQKLLLGFCGLMLIIVLLGLQSISRVTELGGAIDVILRENYQSIIVCQQMKESLDRMDSGALFILSGYEKEGRKIINRSGWEFDNALRKELNNVTIQGEGEKAAHLKTLFDEYKTLIKDVENHDIPRSKRREIYFDKLSPLFWNVKKTADDILYMNQKNMFKSNQQARLKAASARHQLFVLLLIGIVFSSLFILFVGKWILQPIKRLTRSVDEIKRGNLDIVFKSDSRDEIGHLTEAFNEMTSSLREFRRHSEEKMFRIQLSAEQTFNNLPDAVAILDMNGRIEVATETARSIFGLKRDATIQSLFLSWMTELFERAVKGNPTVPAENAMSPVQKFIDAEEHYFHPTAVPIINSKREITGVIMIIKDVTEQLEHNELKRGVISTVSHQLKTPLTSIRMAIHLLLEQQVGTLNPTQAELLIAAQEDSERLHRILENLLDISRIASGKIAMLFQAVPPGKVISDSIESFRTKALERGIKIHTILPGDLPDVWTDMEQIRHVFANLLSNALKYTDSGGTITIIAKVDANQVHFNVSDTGVGIPAYYLPRIFDRFFRVPGQVMDTGIGLGLAIAKEIVEAHGGTVSVESSEGSGSSFTFTLPRADSISRETANHA
jgi:signal transduction histidine kinase/HAMP domain-containing protein